MAPRNTPSPTTPPAESFDCHGEGGLLCGSTHPTLWSAVGGLDAQQKCMGKGGKRETKGYSYLDVATWHA
eukprot:1365556-Prymnesium_polylepis.1